MKLLRDTWLIFQRQMLLVLRHPVWLIVGLAQPAFYLLLFGPLLKSALQTQSSAEAYQIFLPGMLVLLALFGTFFVGFTLIAELRAGVIECSRVTPVSRLALLLGRSMRDVMSLLFQAGIITILSIPLGLAVRIGDVVLVYLLLGLIALMMSALSYGAALKLRSEGALSPLLNTVAQPILLLSGILLPITAATAPGWLVGISQWNPISWAVNAARALFAGNPGDPDVWQALVILSLLTAASVTWTARSFARSVR